MNLTQLATANALLHQREELQEIVGHLENDSDSFLGITFRGTYQNHRIKNIVRPVLIEQFKRDIRSIESQIKQLGIELNQ